MNTYKIKSLLYLILFAISAVIYYHVIPDSAEEHQSKNTPVLAEADSPDKTEQAL